MHWTKQSDALFADMMANTLSIYKVKKLQKGTPQYTKARDEFGKML